MKKTLRQRIARAFDWLIVIEHYAWTSEREIPLSRRARNKLAKACCQDEINYGGCDCRMMAEAFGDVRRRAAASGEQA